MLYIEDDRYTVPTLRVLGATSEERARAEAADCLLESEHHASVEVCRMGEVLFCLTRPASSDDTGMTAHRSASAVEIARSRTTG